MTSKKQTEVDQTSVSASKPGTSSRTAVNLDLPPPRLRTTIQTEDMDVDYGPALPQCLGPDPHDTSDQNVSASELPLKKVSDKPKKHCHSRSRHEIESRSASDQSNEESDEPRIPSTKPKKHSDKSKHKSRSRYVSSSSEEDQSSVARHRSSKPSGAQPSGAASDQDLPQHDPDPPYYREVALSDIPSQYAVEVDTFRHILSLPDPRESMPRSSTSVMGLDDEKGRQELRPRGPSSILPLSSVIKDAFDKFQHDFKAANLPEGKYIKPPPSTVFVRGLRIPSRFSPCKTHSREMAQTSGFDPKTQVKTCFYCKMFDVANWVACLNGDNGPRGTPSHETLSVSFQGALEISSVAGQPPSLDRSHCGPLRLVAKSLKCDERCRPSSQRPQYPTLYRRLKRRLGRSLRSKFYKGSVVRPGEKATYKRPRIEGDLTGPSKLQ